MVKDCNEKDLYSNKKELKDHLRTLLFSNFIYRKNLKAYNERKEALREYVKHSKKDNELFEVLEEIIITFVGREIVSEAIYYALKYFPKKAIDPVAFRINRKEEHGNYKYRRVLSYLRDHRDEENIYFRLKKVITPDLMEKIKSPFVKFYLNFLSFFGKYDSSLSHYEKKIRCYYKLYKFTFYRTIFSKSNSLYPSRLRDKLKETTLKELNEQPKIYDKYWSLGGLLWDSSSYSDKTHDTIILFYKRKYKKHYFYSGFNLTLIKDIISYWEEKGFTYSLKKSKETIFLILNSEHYILFPAINFDQETEYSKPLCPRP
jgi:hypothetical protein